METSTLLVKNTAAYDPVHKFTQDTVTEPAGAWNREQESMRYQHRPDLFCTSTCEVFGKMTEGDELNHVSVWNKYVMNEFTWKQCSIVY